MYEVTYVVNFKEPLLAISTISLTGILLNGVFPYVATSHTKIPKDLQQNSVLLYITTYVHVHTVRQRIMGHQARENSHSNNSMCAP